MFTIYGSSPSQLGFKQLTFNWSLRSRCGRSEDKDSFVCDHFKHITQPRSLRRHRDHMTHQVFLLACKRLVQPVCYFLWPWKQGFTPSLSCFISSVSLLHLQHNLGYHDWQNRSSPLLPVIWIKQYQGLTPLDRADIHLQWVLKFIILMIKQM